MAKKKISDETLLYIYPYTSFQRTRGPGELDRVCCVVAWRSMG